GGVRPDNPHAAIHLNRCTPLGRPGWTKGPDCIRNEVSARRWATMIVAARPAEPRVEFPSANAKVLLDPQTCFSWTHRLRCRSRAMEVCHARNSRLGSNPQP